MSEVDEALVIELKRELREKELILEAQGGRGVELADEIDEIRRDLEVALSGKVPNVERFREVYREILTKYVTEKPEEYAYGPDKVEGVVEKMITSLANGQAHLGPAVKATARRLKVKPTVSGIKDYLAGAVAPVASPPPAADPPWMKDLCEALGWQGGTWTQAIEAVRKLVRVAGGVDPVRELLRPEKRLEVALKLAGVMLGAATIRLDDVLVDLEQEDGGARVREAVHEAHVLLIELRQRLS